MRYEAPAIFEAEVLGAEQPPVRADQEEIWEEAAIRRERRRGGVVTLAAQIGVVVVVVSVWQLVSGTIVDPFFISSPSGVFHRLLEWLSDGTIFVHSLVTVKEALLGFIAGTSAGILGGVVLASMPRVNRVADPFIQGLYAMPRLAFAPLLILWFGIETLSKVVLVAIIVVFFVFYSTYGGVRDVDRELVDVTRVMGASKSQMIRKVVIPSAMSWIFTGVKLAVPYALMGAVVGEMLGSNEGLGFILIRASGSFDTAGIFAVLLVIGVLGMLFNLLVNRADAYVGRWRA